MKQNKERILTGIQPSGDLHIGNYFGAMKPLIQTLDDHDKNVFAFIADYHALTTLQDPKGLQKNVRDALIAWLAAGFDPDKGTFYIQSDVPEVQELSWMLHTVTPMGLLERATSYKDKVQKGLTANSGLFTYPVLMAADILMTGANTVPVGQDQLQHIEITRDIAKNFNKKFGKVFQLPVAMLAENVAVISGTDGNKMSKSYNNTIPLFADESLIRAQVMKMVTDSKSVDEPKDPETCNLFTLFKLVSSPAEQEELSQRYKTGGMGYREIKEIVIAKISQYFAPLRQRRNEIKNDDTLLTRIRFEGAEKAKILAKDTLLKVREAVGVSYGNSLPEDVSISKGALGRVNNYW